jgi:hypothetical protein
VLPVELLSSSRRVTARALMHAACATAVRRNWAGARAFRSACAVAHAPRGAQNGRAMAAFSLSGLPLCELSVEMTARVLEVIDEWDERGALLCEVAKILWGDNPHARAGCGTILGRLEEDGLLVSAGRGRFSRWWLTRRGVSFLEKLRPIGAAFREDRER